MIIAAVMVTDAKLYSFLDCLKALAATPEIDRIYINIETQFDYLYRDMVRYLMDCGKPSDWDRWSFASSTWVPERGFDQDNDARLPGIISARNMAVDYAMQQHAEHLLFVDSDVIIRPDGVRRLLRIEKPLVGGNVPGRGAHAHARYIFGHRRQDGNIIHCDHGTMGYCLIHQSIFQYVRFRRGPHPHKPETWLSEDPCYEADAERLGLCDGWYIDYSVIAEHRDDPQNPLTLEGAINDYDVNQPQVD